MVQLNYWNGHHVVKIDIVDIESIYMTPCPTDDNGNYEINVRFVSGAIVPIRQESEENCVEYLAGFGKMGFIKSWGGHKYYYRSHMDFDKLGEDLEHGISEPVWSIKRDGGRRMAEAYEMEADNAKYSD